MDRHSSVDLVKTLARTNNPQTSKDAAEKMVVSGELNRQENLIYQAICDLCRTYPKYWKGFTTKDVAKRMVFHSYNYNFSYDKAYDICRKRFSGLRDKGKIELAGGQRDGCRVWRLKNA